MKPLRCELEFRPVENVDPSYPIPYLRNQLRDFTRTWVIEYDLIQLPAHAFKTRLGEAPLMGARILPSQPVFAKHPLHLLTEMTPEVTSTSFADYNILFK